MASENPSTLRHQFILNLLLFFSFFLLLDPDLIKGEQSYPQKIPARIMSVEMMGQAPDASDEEARKQVESIVRGMLEKNPSLFEGIKSVMVSVQDLGFFANGSCSGHVLGAFSEGRIIIKDSGEETNRKTLYHEIGHNSWRRMTSQEQEEWTSLFSSSKKFATPYASTSPEEDFAESFSCHMTSVQGCAELLEGKKEFLNRIERS